MNCSRWRANVRATLLILFACLALVSMICLMIVKLGYLLNY